MPGNRVARAAWVVVALVVALSAGTTAVAAVGDDGGLLDDDGDDDGLVDNTTDTLESTTEETLDSDDSDDSDDSTIEGTLDSTTDTLTDDSTTESVDAETATDPTGATDSQPSVDRLAFADLPDADALVEPPERVHYVDGLGVDAAALGITEGARWGALVSDERAGASEYAAVTDGEESAVLYTTGTLRHQERSGDAAARVEAGDRRLDAGVDCESTDGGAPCAYRVDGAPELPVGTDVADVLRDVPADPPVEIGRLPDNADALLDL